MSKPRQPRSGNATTSTVWDAASARGRFTLAQLMDDTGAARGTLNHMIAVWCRDGFVRYVGRSPSTGRGIHYEIVALDEDGSRAAAVRYSATPEDNMWRTIKILRVCSTRDIAAHSTTPTTNVSESDASRFCEMLCRGGYMRRREAAKPSIDRPAVYQLLNYTGPIPPRTVRITAIVDANTGQYAHLPEAAP